MSKSVFISRDLTAESPFKKRLSQANIEVFGKYLVEFEPVDFSVPPVADWVFCYSSRAVDFFLAGLRRLKLSPDRYANYAAMGSGTAKRLKDKGIVPAFLGSGEPTVTAEAFLERARGGKVLFPHAEQSRRSIQRLLENKLDMLDVIVYRNRKLKDPDLPKTTYAVLTSPLNAQAYFSGRQEWQEQRIIAIGATTAGALKKMGLSNFRTAERPSEEALAQAVLNWEKSEK